MSREDQFLVAVRGGSKQQLSRSTGMLRILENINLPQSKDTGHGKRGKWKYNVLCITQALFSVSKY